jgi:hypothetical protein
MKTNVAMGAVAMLLGLSASPSFAAPDWSKVPARKITVFYPGTASIEWATKVSSHSGAQGLKQGETCAACHDEEAAEIGRKIVSGEKLEPLPPKGKAGSIPVAVQAAYDANNLYLRFTFKEPPPSGGEKMDKDHALKLAVMLEDQRVEGANLAGCWQTCHQDARTMPGADDRKTKYVRDGSLSAGRYYDLMQWKSGKAAKPVDGYVADKRVMEGGKALVAAEGKIDGGNMIVTFVRKLTGGEGDIALVPGKRYNFGFAIHDGYSTGRFHYVSLGYTLGLDAAKADVRAARQ